MRSLDIAATGMLAQQTNVDVISNNIANMSTTGFKRQNVAFMDMMYQNIVRPGATSSDVGTIMPSGLQIGLGTRVGGVYRMHQQGALQITDNPFDLAITGDGFFQVQLPNGDTAYTRDGTFSVNQDGELVTQQGFVVEPGIVVPDDAVDVTINASGEVFASIQGQVNLSNLGQIQLATFVNETGLESIGNNTYLETEASGTPTTGNPAEDNFGDIQQGALENSNVNVVEEITDLIEAQRAYEMNSKVITTSDEMMGTVTQLR
jgi:flagellar basal-body rod protein FlgG